VKNSDLCNDVEEINDFMESNEFNIQEPVEFFTEKLQVLQEKYIPIKIMRVKNPEIKWLNSDIIDLMNRRDHFKRLSDRSSGLLKSQYLEKYKSARNLTVAMIRKSKKSYLVSAVAEAENADNKTSKLWQTLRLVVPTKKALNQYCQQTANDGLNENDFNIHFTQTPENMINSFQEIFGEPDIDIITSEKFTFPIIQKKEIETELRKVSVHKASGFNYLNARLINIFALLLLKLCLLFNKSK
jgi:hypothetical protein